MTKKNTSVDTTNFEPWRLRMREAVLGSGLDITKISSGLGLHRDYITRLINLGKAKPDPDLFIAICDAVGASPGYIIEGDVQTSKKDRVARRLLEAEDKTINRIEQILNLVEADQDSE